MLLSLKKRKKKDATALGALVQQEQAVAEQITKLEDMIAEAPERIRREYEETRGHMPPPDDWEDRQREKRFYANLSRGEVRNEHRCQTRSTALFVLLTIAIVSVLSWMVSFLKTIA